MNVASLQKQMVKDAGVENDPWQSTRQLYHTAIPKHLLIVSFKMCCGLKRMSSLKRTLKGASLTSRDALAVCRLSCAVHAIDFRSIGKSSVFEVDFSLRTLSLRTSIHVFQCTSCACDGVTYCRPDKAELPRPTRLSGNSCRAKFMIRWKNMRPYLSPFLSLL